MTPANTLEGQLLFNNLDVYKTYKFFPPEGGLNALITPPQRKSPVTSANRLKNGENIINIPSKGLYEPRDINITLQAEFDDNTTAVSRFYNLCEALEDMSANGGQTIQVKFFNVTKTRHLLYISASVDFCTQGLISVKLKFREPQPA